ncbi:MAG TPA: hypothetical protein VF843_11415, partial [Streptosporangiaceae bacterium]
VASGGPASPRSDLYALGCVLFEMLTGTPPFTADADVAVAYRHVHDDPGPPSARRPELPGHLDWVTTQLLAKDPAARPASAAQAKAGLLAALTPGRTAVLPPAPGGTATQPDQAEPDLMHTGRRGRRPTRPELVLGAVAIACLAGLLVAVLSHGASGPSGRRPASHPSVASHPSTSARPSVRPSPASPSPSRLGGPTSPGGSFPPVATAAGRFVAVLQAGLASGQVSQQAGQNLFNQLQQLLFEPPGQNPQQVQQRYDQLVQQFDQYRSSNEITGQSAAQLGYALALLRRAVGAR